MKTTATLLLLACYSLVESVPSHRPLLDEGNRGKYHDQRSAFDNCLACQILAQSIRTRASPAFPNLQILSPFFSPALCSLRIVIFRRHVAADPRRNLDLDRLISLRKYASRDDRGESQRRNANGEDEPESWTGRWMPDRPNDPTPPPKVFPKMDQTADFESSHSFHGVPMGYSSKSCDDAKVIHFSLFFSLSLCFDFFTDPWIKNILISCLIFLFLFLFRPIWPSIGMAIQSVTPVTTKESPRIEARLRSDTASASRNTTS